MTAAAGWTPHQLSRAECRALLGETNVGRVITIAPRRIPTLIPVDFSLVFDEIIFTSGAEVEAVTANHDIVTFEADDFGLSIEDGWSVSVRGMPAIVADPLELQGLELVAPDLYDARESDDHFFRLPTRFISGMRARNPVVEEYRLRLV